MILRAACILICALSGPVHARHLHHHRHLHRQYARQNANPISNIVPPTDSGALATEERIVISDGNALVHDLQEVEQGLLRLPKDFSSFLNAVERLERLIGGLLPASPSGEQIVSILTSSTPTTVTAPSQTTASTCYVPGPLGGPVSCSEIHVASPVTTTLAVETLPGSDAYGGYSLSAGGRSIWPTNATYTNTTATASTTTLQYASSVATPPLLSPGDSPSAFYIFNPQARNNLAVYYGQTPSTQAGGLFTLCQDVNVDIVILAFVTDFFGSNGYPWAEFGPACWASTSSQAPDLANCTALAPEITACQNMGKKVLVSLGGADGDSSLGSDSQAEAFAVTLWNLFGAGTNDTDLRPFGPNVVVDGFDIDNEDHSTDYYDTFATALREQFAQDPSKTYYLSAAPQCPMPDASIPTELMYEADFVWVQFYNNPQCNLGSGGFATSFQQWSQNLAAGGSSGKPRLYIGAPGAATGAGSGYVPGSNLSLIVDQVLALNVSNMGGIMLWDGSEAMANVDSTGVNYLQYAKSSLQL